MMLKIERKVKIVTFWNDHKYHLIIENTFLNTLYLLLPIFSIKSTNLRSPIKMMFFEWIDEKEDIMEARVSIGGGFLGPRYTCNIKLLIWSYYMSQIRFFTKIVN